LNLITLAQQHKAVIVQIDALAGLDLLPEASIDLTVTDPPFESLEQYRKIGTTTRLKISERSSNQWFDTFENENYPALFAKLFIAHKSNTHAYCFCDNETEHVLLSASNPYNKTASRPGTNILSTGWRAWPTLAWIKTKSNITSQLRKDVLRLLSAKSLDKNVGETSETSETNVANLANLSDASLSDADAIAKMAELLISTGLGYHWRRSKEHIVFIEKGKRSLNNNSWCDVLFGQQAPRNGWPAQKPLSLVQRLISNSSAIGEIVLDPFMGSATTLVAAARLGRRAIGLDTNPMACKEAVKRIGAYWAKP
jgi:DNA modification methylase